MRRSPPGPFSPQIHALLAILLSGCASGSPPAVSPSATWCPTPLTWVEGKPRPVRLEVTNRTNRSLSVYLDQCSGSVRLGSLEPGQKGGFRLPTTLIPFQGNLHIHMGDMGARTHFGSFAVPAVMEWTLSLWIDEDTPRVDKAYDPRTPPPPGTASPQGFQTSPGETLGYASTWADGTNAVLTWVCREEGRQLSFSPVRTEADLLPVAVRFQEEGDEVEGEWTVVHGRSDNLLAPAASVGALTRRALATETLWLSLESGADPRLHRFDVRGLAEALGSLQCFEGILR